ncbi:MAG: polysaccharide biosynthesis tyrosine autokinase [Gemmataceae bacterium]
MMPQDAGLPDPSIPFPTPRQADLPAAAGRVEVAPPPPPPHSPPPPGLSAAPDIFGLLSALRRRWVSAVLLGGALGAAAGAGLWYLLTPKHTAFATLQVNFAEPRILANGANSAGDFKTFLQTTAAQVISRPVIASALKRDEVRRLGLEIQELDAAQAISDDLRTEFKENSEMLTVFFNHADPQVALTVLKGLQEAYLEEWVYAQQNKRNRKVTQLEKVYNDNTDALKRKRDNLKNLAEKLGTIDPALWREQRIEVNQALTRAKDQHVQVGFKLIEGRASLETLDARLAGMAKWASDAKQKGGAEGRSPAFEEALDEAAERDPESKQIRARIDAYEVEVEELRSKGYGANYFEVKALRRRAETARGLLAKRRADLAERVKKALARAAIPGANSGTPQYVEDPKILRDHLKKQVDSLVTMEEGLRKDIDRLSKEAAKTPVLASEYEHLAAEIKSEDQNSQEILRRLDQERVELQAANRISKFQDAELMKRDNKKQILAAAAAPVAVFATVSLGLAWLEFRKRRVRAAGEISRGLGIRVVGAVPAVRHLERQLVNPAGESDLEGTPVMESIDAIRTRLLHEANTRSTRVVMVTSAAPGEGKTTLAAALATSLARAGRKTLLLDGDLRRPAVHELFEVPPQPGFSEVLLGEVEMAEAAVESAQENLWLMTAGQWDREVLLALSRDGLEGVFDRLADEFDFIVVDSHPVLAATDSLLIGRQADAVLLSVLREVSEMPRVYAASQQLTAVGIRVIGAVVNGTDPEEVYTSAAAPAAVA